MLIFRSARRGRCRARQLRVHGSGAAHDTTRWGCEPHTLGPILQLQGFYTTGCRVRVHHSRMSMLESSFRRGGSPSALRLEERRVASNLGVGELRSELPRGGGGGGSRGAGLSTNNTAPQRKFLSGGLARGIWPLGRIRVSPEDMRWPALERGRGRNTSGILAIGRVLGN